MLLGLYSQICVVNEQVRRLLQQHGHITSRVAASDPIL